MAFSYWGTSQQEFRPGFKFAATDQLAAATVNTRALDLFTAANMDYWFKDGTAPGIKLKIALNSFNTAEGVYNWSLWDDYMDMACLNELGGNPLFIHVFDRNRYPQWMINEGLTFLHADGVTRIGRWDLADFRSAMLDIFTAIKTRYESSRRFWSLMISEGAIGNSSAFPSGYTVTTDAIGRALVLNGIHDIFEGRITVTAGSMTRNVADRCYSGQPGAIATHLPDPRFFQTTDSIQVAVDDFAIRPIIMSSEANGFTATSYPAGVSNPLGYDENTPAHIFTPQEWFWYGSNQDWAYPGQRPSHVMIALLLEHGGAPSTFSRAAVVAAADEYMAGGLDVSPALPDGYEDEVEQTDGTFTSVTAGTISSSGSPGAPSGTGGVLLCVSVVRLGSETFNNPSGWQLAATVGSGVKIAAWLRESTGDSGDVISGHDFASGTSINFSQIYRITGDTESIASIIEQTLSVAYGYAIADNTTPAATIAQPNRLVMLFGTKRKTATSNGATITSPTGLDNRLQTSWGSGSNLGFTADYTIQTDAEDIAAGILDQSVEETEHAATLMLVFKPALVDAAPNIPSTVGGSSTGQTSGLITHDDETNTDTYRYYATQIGATVYSTPFFIGSQTQAQKTSNSGYPWLNLSAATLYKFKVTAVSASGLESDYSAEGSFTTDTPADTTAPTPGNSGNITLTQNSENGNLLIEWTEGTDNLSATADLKYGIFIAYGAEDVDFTSPDYLTEAGVDNFTIPFDELTIGTIKVVVRPMDEAGYFSTNTTPTTATITQPGFTATLTPWRNNTNSLIPEGTVIRIRYWMGGNPVDSPGTTPDYVGDLEVNASNQIDLAGPTAGAFWWHGSRYNDGLLVYEAGSGDGVFA